MSHRIPLLLFLSLAAATTTTNAADTPAPGPEAIVQKQLEAYNARDIDAFVATYADDVQLFEFPDKLLMRGHDELREQYRKTFADPRLHAEIVRRIVLGNTVIDHERVRVTFPDGPGTVEAVAIYEVRDGKIAAVWFRRGERKLDATK